MYIRNYFWGFRPLGVRVNYFGDFRPHPTPPRRREFRKQMCSLRAAHLFRPLLGLAESRRRESTIQSIGMSIQSISKSTI